MLKEQVAEILTQLSSKSHYFNNEEMELYLDSYVMQVCNLIKAEVDKLTLIDPYDCENFRDVAIHQLRHTKAQILYLISRE